MTAFLFLSFFLNFHAFAERPAVQEIREVTTNHPGYQEAWIRIRNRNLSANSRELPVELNLPLCNANSVHKVDERCISPDGKIAIVTAIKGRIVSFERVNLSTTQNFERFASQVRVNASSRMPASLPEVVCVASCARMENFSPCQAKGENKTQAFQQLSALMQEKADSDCKGCVLKSALCDGKPF